jgi:hypothetical protein
MSNSNNESHTAPLGEMLYENLRNLNMISDRLLNDYKTKNKILHEGLKEYDSHNNVLVQMKGGKKKRK